MSLVSCRIIRWSPPARWGRSCSNAPNLHAAGALLIHLLRVVASAATPLRPDSPAYRSVKFSTDDSVYDTTGDDTRTREGVTGAYTYTCVRGRERERERERSRGRERGRSVGPGTGT